MKPNGKSTDLQMREQIQALRDEIKQLKQREPLKVSPKGAVSYYGTGKYPVTLYADQWERVLGQAEAIKAFINANANLLKPPRGGEQ